MIIAGRRLLVAGEFDGSLGVDMSVRLLCGDVVLGDEDQL
jgi:hypothetical protein